MKKVCRLCFSTLLIPILIFSAPTNSTDKVLEVGALDSLLISKGDGLTLKFKTVSGANKYVVYDDNDYRDNITFTSSNADSNGYIYYTPEVVGDHNVYVRAYSDNGFVTSNVIKSVTVEPIFDYGIGAPVFFYDLRDGSNSNYTIIKDDGTLEYVSQSTFNSSYITNRNGIIDFTTTSLESYKISNIFASIKEMGSNIVKLDNRFCDIETGSQWWWGGSFENSVCKRMMDAAWKIGLKCIISDFTILSNCEYDNGPSIAKSRVVTSDFIKACQHPAFYGIELNDEPLPTKIDGQNNAEIVNSALTVKAILDTWHSNPTLSLLPDPVIRTDLCSYNDVSDDYFDNGASEYEEYLETWITNSGLRTLDFDYYTYTTYEYGTKKIGTTNYHYDSSKVIYDSINNLKVKYPGLKVSQTLTRSNATSRNDLTVQDVFASTLLSISQDCNGYSTYTFAPSNGSQENECVTREFVKTDTFTWAKNAHNQYKVLKGLLDGFELTSNTMSNYNKKYFSTYYYGYGTDVRTSSSLFTNKSGNTCNMVVNFNTGSSSTESVTVASGKTYYLFGDGKSCTPLIGNGSSVKLNNGEAILVFNNNEKPIDNISKSVELGYSASFNGLNFTKNSDKFVIKLAIDYERMSSLIGDYTEYGIYVETSSKSHCFPSNSCTLENNNKNLVVVINLGSALSNGKTGDTFTVKAYAKNGSGTIYSNDNNLQFSINSIVKDLYSTTDTRTQVITLYNYMVSIGLI